VPKPTPVYTRLREQIIRLKPGEVGIFSTPDLPHVWGVLMEIGFPKAAVTLVALADGTASLYYGTGGGIVGGGHHAVVAAAARAMVASAEGFLQDMSSTSKFPLPDVGWVVFYVLTYTGACTAVAIDGDLRAGGQPLSPLYYRGQEVITQLRLLEEGKS
jgi:hypothetical protein